jgi:hypothetical protein
MTHLHRLYAQHSCTMGVSLYKNCCCCTDHLVVRSRRLIKRHIYNIHYTQIQTQLLAFNTMQWSVNLVT